MTTTTVYEKHHKTTSWVNDDSTKEWHYEGFSLCGAVTFQKPQDELDFAYHAVMIDPVDGEEGDWGGFNTIDAARLWVESQDFAAHARNLSDRSALADLPEDYFQ